ncbi:hypothetical protein SK128_025141 [Halocaridina rubra]|uniref:Cytochrome P450 n=1 Tax=Halocaridina rubra TaxID=373956 RepID=A0AAN8ZY53_HALRR
MIALAVLVILSMILLLTWTNRKPKGLPPGIWGWPIIGATAPSGLTVNEYVKVLHKKYGNIFTWKMGSRTMVFLNGYPLIKQAFNNPSLQDRPDFFTFDVFSGFKKVGIANSNGKFWQNGRRFALRQLKDLGLGKSTLLDAMEYEAASLVKDFQKHVGNPTLVPYSMNVAILNVIWRLIADVRYDVEDEEIQEFERLITSAFEEIQGYNIVFDMFPYLVPITPIFIRKKLGIESMVEKFDEIRDFVLRVVDEHVAKFDNNNLKDYIDVYLSEMEAHKDDPNSTFSRHDLWVQVADIFTAATETTATSLRWTILFLAKYTDIQKRLQEEIDAAVPRDRLPTLQDKHKMPYLEAVVNEVQRFVTLVPLGVTHFCAEDTELEGYKIPKGTVIMPNFESCHFDPNYWEKPNEFYPEHFLDENGKPLTKKDSFIPFSIGRRMCPGENLARTNIFLFLTALLQNLEFSAPEGEEINLEKDVEKPLFHTPRDVKIVISNRK